MPKRIEGFFGEYRFLSNFWPVFVYMDDERYKSVEHAYQAAKTLNKDERQRIQKAEAPHIAKKLGRQITIRDDWDEIKLQVMEDLVRQKFTALPYLLLDTDDAYLEETNPWKDTFWGVCEGIGDNHLGRILMKIRQELRE